MKIIIIDQVSKLLIKSLEKNNIAYDIKDQTPKDEIQKIIKNYDGIIIRSRFVIDKAFINDCENLKFIARAGSGMENIDTNYAELKGIKCFNAAAGNANAVAEHALAMLLNLFNNINQANQEVKNGVWQREKNRGIELSGKTIGIIGFGNNGSAFASLLSGFNIKILAYDKYLANYNFKSTLKDIFQKADILSLHINLNKENTYYVDRKFIENFKKPIYLINTSRGKCAKNEAIVYGLKNQKILGACLDVMENEKTSFEDIVVKKNDTNLNYILRSENTILSPHIAGWTKESKIKISNLITEKIISLK